MSSQSILVRDTDLIQEKAEKTILENAQSWMLRENFAIKKKTNPDKVRHANKILGFICTDNCELKEHINKVLRGDVDEKDSCISCEEDTCDTFQLSNYVSIFEHSVK